MYELSSHPSAYYLALFKAQSVVVLPPDDGRVAHECKLRAPPGRGLVEIKAGELEFEVYFDVDESSVNPDDVRTAEAVLSQVVEMDSAARAFPHGSDFDHGEYLAYIKVGNQEVELRYFATTVNTEWSAYFQRDSQGVFRVQRLGG